MSRAHGVSLSRLTALGLVWWACATPAAAQSTRVQLLWQRPIQSHCPSAAELEADVAQAVSDARFVHDGVADVVVRGSVQEDERGAHVQIEASTRDGQRLGSRSMEAPEGECAALRGSIALVLTLLIDATPRVARSSSAASGHRAHELGAALAAMSGLLPRMTLGLALSYALVPVRWLRLHSELSYWLPVRIETRTGQGARLQAVSLSLEACPVLMGGEQGWSLALCAGGQLGPLLAAPRELSGPNRQARLLAQGLVNARLRFSHRTLALEAALGLAASFHRPRFWYERNDESRAFVFRPAPAGIFFSLGLIKL